jgi:hypothetical protein
MEYVVDKRLKLDEPFMSDLQSTQPRPIKVTDPVSNSIRADVKALENAKTGKVTTVVVVMHLYGNVKSILLDISHLLALQRSFLPRNHMAISTQVHSLYFSRYTSHHFIRERQNFPPLSNTSLGTLHTQQKAKPHCARTTK